MIFLSVSGEKKHEKRQRNNCWVGKIFLAFEEMVNNDSFFKNPNNECYFLHREYFSTEIYTHFFASTHFLFAKIYVRVRVGINYIHTCKSREKQPTFDMARKKGVKMFVDDEQIPGMICQNQSFLAFLLYVHNDSRWEAINQAHTQLSLSQTRLIWVMNRQKQKQWVFTHRFIIYWWRFLHPSSHTQHNTA